MTDIQTRSDQNAEKIPQQGVKEAADARHNVDDMLSAEDEAKKRHITVQQWLSLLHFADIKSENEKWIDKQFQFPGNGKITVDGDLNLNEVGAEVAMPELAHLDPTLPTTLPEGLTVNGNLWLNHLTSLTGLPKDLSAEGIVLSKLHNEQVWDDAERLVGEDNVYIPTDFDPGLLDGTELDYLN